MYRPQDPRPHTHKGWARYQHRQGFPAHQQRTGRPHHDLIVLFGGRALGGSCELHITRRPAGNHVGNEIRIRFASQQMIGFVQADKTLGVFRGNEEIGRIVNANNLVAGRV